VSRLQVLIACSDSEQRAALMNVLALCDLQPMIAANLSEVRRALERGSVDLAFCEDRLPGGGFREALRMIKATGSNVPLVVSSPLGELDQYLEAMQLGAFDFVAPPYRRAEVESIVNSVRQDYLSKGTEGTRLNVQAEAVSRNEAAA